MNNAIRNAYYSAKINVENTFTAPMVLGAAAVLSFGLLVVRALMAFAS